jgi:hypothetical protein
LLDFIPEWLPESFPFFAIALSVTANIRSPVVSNKLKRKIFVKLIISHLLIVRRHRKPANCWKVAPAETGATRCQHCRRAGRFDKFSRRVRMKRHSLCTVDGGVISYRFEMPAGPPEAGFIFCREFLENAAAGN